MEWTFEQADACWQRQVRPVQHVGVPGYQFQAGVLWDGSLVFGPIYPPFVGLEVIRQETQPLGNHFLHLSIGYGDPMRFADRYGSGSPNLRRSLDEGRFPIPTVETREGGLIWRETVFAHLDGKPPEAGMRPEPDDRLVVDVRFRVSNPGPGSRTGHLWLHFGDTSQVEFGMICHLRPQIAPAIPHRFEPPFGWVGGKVRYVLPTPVHGLIRWHDETPLPEGVSGSARNLLEWETPLASGQEAALRLLIPYGLVDQKKAEKLASEDRDHRFEEVRRFWRKLQYGPGQITTPDPFLNDFLVAIAGQMAQQVAYRARSTKVWMYKTSPNQYEAYWPCNAAEALPAFDLRGLTRLSRPVLQSFMDLQTDDVGSLTRSHMGHGPEIESEGFSRRHGFLGNFGEWTANPLLLSHGLELWALAAHYRITRDNMWLGEGSGSPLQALLDGFDWIAHQRRRTMYEVEGQKTAYWGLLPAASAHDSLAANAPFNDAFCIYGMAEVVRLLREIAHPGAQERAQELNEYRACLRDRTAEARDRAHPLPLPDRTSIPYVPRVIQESDWARIDWTYVGCGPLRYGAWGAFDPHDELIDQALAFLEAGMPQGEGPYLDWHKNHPDTANNNWDDVSDLGADRHYLWRHYVEYESIRPVGGPLFLARDDLPRFFEWFFNNMAVVIHRDWRVGAEFLDGVPSTAPGDGERWLMLRRMFVNEYGGYDGSGQSLWLCQAIPRSWLRPGCPLKVEKMGTFFGGQVDLNLAVALGGDKVTATVRLRGLAVTPEEIRIRLRSGDGRPLRSARVNGVPAQVLPGDILRLPKTTGGDYKITGRF